MPAVTQIVWNAPALPASSVSKGTTHLVPHAYPAQTPTAGNVIPWVAPGVKEGSSLVEADASKASPLDQQQ